MIKMPGFTTNSTFAGSFRQATASGSMTAGATNFSPGPAVIAQLASAKTGELDVVHWWSPIPFSKD